MQDLKVSLIQCPLVWEDAGANLMNFSRMLEFIENKPDIIILPEMFSTGFTRNTGAAESMDGNAVTWMNTESIKHQCVITGSVFISEQGKYFNRLIWMKPDGTYDYYDKRHLFRMGNEHELVTGGSIRKTVDCYGWKINLQVCYDLRFPVWSKNSFTDGQYDFDVLLYVANWPEVRSHAYKSLLVARAIENQAFVIWVNRTGSDNKGINHSGDSMVIDPHGNIIARAHPGKEEILETVINRKLIDDFRENFKVGLDWDHFWLKM